MAQEIVTAEPPATGSRETNLRRTLAGAFRLLSKSLTEQAPQPRKQYTTTLAARQHDQDSQTSRPSRPASARSTAEWQQYTPARIARAVSHVHPGHADQAPPVPIVRQHRPRHRHPPAIRSSLDARRTARRQRSRRDGRRQHPCAMQPLPRPFPHRIARLFASAME